MSGRPDFEMLYSIMTNRKFLSMEGLGKEVPFFVHTYDISLQDAVFTGITSLQKRLVTSGTDTLLIGLYDMVIDYFKDHDELEDIFDFEKNSTKDLLFQELVSIFNSDDVIKPNVRSRL
ncbi:MAG: hypothetical protein RBT69_13755, partial [Spirochaetia bacterium]|nr:hypothetical protein [Spirochaetia bacterium]